MPALAVTLSLDGKRCVIIGGGAVALRRAAALLEAGASVMVIAPHIEPALAAMKIEAVARPYKKGDLEGAFLAVIATDDRSVNEAAAAEAGERGVLINRADEGDAGDVRFPATVRFGPVTVAVDTGGALPEAAAEISVQLTASLDRHWPEMIETAGPIRAAIRRNVADRETRRVLIRRLFDREARALFLAQGAAAYRSHCQSLLAQSLAPILA